MKVSSKIESMVNMGIDDNQISKPNYVDLVILIRSIQRAEGYMDCYRRGLQQCDRMDCVWRDHCLMAPEEPSKAGSESNESQKAANPKQVQDSLH